MVNENKTERKLLIQLTMFKRGVSYGFEEYVINLLNYIVANRKSINVDNIYISCRDSQVSFLRDLTQGAVVVVGVPCHSLKDKLIAPYKAIKMVSISNFDVVLYPCNTLPFFDTPGRKLLVVHDLLFRHGEFCSKTFSFRKFRILRYVKMPNSLKNANKIIAISNYAKSEIEKYYHTPSNKIDVIYNYFDFEKFAQKNRVSNMIEIERPYFLSVCSKVKHKNHQIFLKAFEIFAKTDSKIKYVVVGGISNEALPFYDSLDNDIKRRIIILEHLSNMQLCYLYKNARAYISASLYEGLGMPVVEAMSFGIPAILSDLPIHREVSLGHGYYFNPDNAEELYEIMKNLDNDNEDYSLMIKNAYSELNTSAKYVKLINDIVGGGIL